MPIKKELIYPFFIECYQYCDDIFWENIFEDLSYGKAPYGSYISKDMLCCKIKNKEFTYKIEKKNPLILYEEISNLFITKLKILTQKEKTSQLIVFNQIENDIKNSRKKWSSIRRKNIKDVLYEQFVIEKKKQYNLTIVQTKKLLAYINLAIMFKTISAKDIVYNNDKIENINGIYFENGNYIIQKSIFPENISELRSEPQKENFMYENWNKFIKNLYEKKI